MPTEQEYCEDFLAFFRSVEALGDNTLGYCLSHTRTADQLAEFQHSQGLDIDNIPDAIRFSLVHRCIHNNTNASTFLNYIQADQKVPPYQVTLLKLYAYLQVIETKYIYKVVGNGLKALRGDPMDGALFDDVFSGYGCFKRILGLCDPLLRAGTTFSLFEKWERIVDRDLRNAIAHNDFVILDKPGIVLIPYYMINQIVDPQTNPPRDNYSFDDIHSLYQEAVKFSEGFKRAASEYVDFGPRY
jgi:hypothetical protein